MTKVLRCGDLMPGCGYVARADDEGELMRKVAEHAREAHGMQSVPPDVAEKVKEAVRDE
jgi:predicted small metal-binding protein